MHDAGCAFCIAATLTLPSGSILTHQPPFLQRSLRASILGLPGIVALPFLIDAPAGVPAAALAIGPAILLIAAALAGAWASVRVDVQSQLILGGRMRSKDIILGITVGVFAGVAVAAIDQATLPLWRGEAIRPPSVIENVTPRQLAIGVLYGGLTEEVVFRWGLGSVIAALLVTRLSRTSAIRIAVVTSAILFAIAHLPATFDGVEVWQASAIMRTLGWNVLLGCLFGALFFSKGLEAAILAHVGFHLGTAMTPLF